MIDKQQLFLILGSLGLLFVGLLIWLFYLQSQVNRITEHYTRLLADASLPDLKAAWDNHLDKILTLTKAVAMISDEQNSLAHRMAKVVQKVGLFKYDADNNIGGKQSFLLALLDEENTGVLVNCIHSRSGTRVYAKPIKTGLSEHTLTKEEEAAIHLANKRT